MSRYVPKYEASPVEIRPSPLRWLPMVRYHTKTLFGRRFVWLILFMSFAPAFVLSAFIYVGSSEGAAQQGLEFIYRGLIEQTDGTVSDETLESLTDGDMMQRIAELGAFMILVYYQSFFVMVAVSVAGAGLIAKDIMSNALEIYLTKPISALDYVLGKLSVVGSIVVLVTLAPSLLVFAVACLLWPGFLQASWSVLPPLILCCAVAAGVNGMVMLALSSLSRSSRYAAVFWFALCLFSHVAGTLLAEETRIEAFHVVSYRSNFEMIFAAVFRITTSHEIGTDFATVPLAAPILVLGAMVVWASWVLRRTLTRGAIGISHGH